jgi:hypothetical protein
MLKGEAKTRYMRDYMRRRRAQQAGQPRLQVDPAVGDPATSEVRQRLEARVGELEAEVAQLTAENVRLRARATKRDLQLRSISDHHSSSLSGGKSINRNQE